MNLGNNKQPIYICDKCERMINNRKDVCKHYTYDSKTYAVKRDFELCKNCEKELREWLKGRHINIKF